MIIRSKHDKSNPYLSISMKLLRDRRLTSEERDCLIMMLSNVDDWEFSYQGLATQLGIRRETVKARVQSLIEKGYVSVSYPLGENGKPLPFAKGVWEIREEPIRAGSAGTIKPAHTCTVYSDYSAGTSEQALANRHEDLDTTNPAQRNTEGINRESPVKNQQEENHQEGKNHHLQETQAQDEEEVSLPPYQFPSFSSGFSSEATASPLQGKKPGYGEEVISQKEHMYQQFLEKFPKAPLVREKELTRQAFFNIPNLEQEFDRIMWGLDEWCHSPEWRKDNGQYIKKPLNWIEERQWEKANVSEAFSDAYMDQLDILFPTEED